MRHLQTTSRLPRMRLENTRTVSQEFLVSSSQFEFSFRVFDSRQCFALYVVLKQSAPFVSDELWRDDNLAANVRDTCSAIACAPGAVPPAPGESGDRETSTPLSRSSSRDPI